MKFGSITTGIVSDGLIFNVDAANRASYPAQRTLTTSESGSCYNTLDLSISGSFISDPQFITQPISASCWDFDGIDDYIELGQINSSNILSLYGTTEQTWEVWINSNGTGDGYQRIFDKSDAGGGINGWFLSLGGVADNDQISCKIDNDNTDGLLNGDVDFTHNTWQHLVVTRINNTTNGWNVYINGTLKLQQDSSNVTVPSDTTGCRIGSWNHSTAREFNGQIASVRLYNRALSANEVLHNYNALKGRFT